VRDAHADQAHSRPAKRAQAAALPRFDDPKLKTQRAALRGALQYPGISGTIFDAIPPEAFTHPAYNAIAVAIHAAGGTSAGITGPTWVDVISQAVDPGLVMLVSELAVEDMPADIETVPRYLEGVLARLQEAWVGEQVADLKSKLARMSSARTPDDYYALMGDLLALEQYRRSLLKQAIGDTSA
jgi:DNA primase